MQRFFQNNQELVVGQPCTFLILTPQGFKRMHVEKMTEDMLAILTMTGLAVMKEDNEPAPEKKNSRKNISYYVRRFGNRKKMSKEDAYRFYNLLVDLVPTSAYQLVLKEIALELDKNYPDHIRDSKEIYVISNTSGNIMAVDKSHIVNYNNFAAFRTPEDAQYALSIVREFHADLFKADAPVKQ